MPKYLYYVMIASIPSFCMAMQEKLIKPFKVIDREIKADQQQPKTMVDHGSKNPSLIFLDNNHLELHDIVHPEQKKQWDIDENYGLLSVSSICDTKRNIYFGTTLGQIMRLHKKKNRVYFVDEISDLLQSETEPCSIRKLIVDNGISSPNALLIALCGDSTILVNHPLESERGKRKALTLKRNITGMRRLDDYIYLITEMKLYRKKLTSSWNVSSDPGTALFDFSFSALTDQPAGSITFNANIDRAVLTSAHVDKIDATKLHETLYTLDFIDPEIPYEPRHRILTQRSYQETKEQNQSTINETCFINRNYLATCNLHKPCITIYNAFTQKEVCLIPLDPSYDYDPTALTAHGEYIFLKTKKKQLLAPKVLPMWGVTAWKVPREALPHEEQFQHKLFDKEKETLHDVVFAYKADEEKK